MWHDLLWPLVIGGTVVVIGLAVIWYLATDDSYFDDDDKGKS